MAYINICFEKHPNKDWFIGHWEKCFQERQKQMSKNPTWRSTETIFVCFWKSFIGFKGLIVRQLHAGTHSHVWLWRSCSGSDIRCSGALLKNEKRFFSVQHFPFVYLPACWESGLIEMFVCWCVFCNSVWHNECLLKVWREFQLYVLMLIHWNSS